MMRSTHVNMTLSVGLIALIITGNFSIHLYFAGIYAIIQDWDHHNGYMKGFFGFSLPFKHRGFTHTLLFVLLIILLINIAVFGYQYGSAIANTGLSFITMDLVSSFIEDNKTDNFFLFILLHAHLLGDFLTSRGIPYFYPFLKNKKGDDIYLKIPLVSTGKKEKGEITREMYINFGHSVLNIYLIYYLIANWASYGPTIIEKLQSIANSGDIVTIFLLVFLQLVFIIFLFWRDIKKYIQYFKEFVKRLTKVVVLTTMGAIITGIIGGGFYLLNLDLSSILSNATNGSIIINNLNDYFYMLIITCFFLYSIYLTKKYIISLATTILYIIRFITYSIY